MKRSVMIANQGRRPRGVLGQLVGRIMAAETAEANRVALDRLDLRADDRLLDVGCGHGRALALAAETITTGRLAGIDFSEVMLAIARGRNRRLLRTGRLELTFGPSEALPYQDGAFNKALSVHTIYFWRRPERDLAQIARVLAPGGRFVLGFRPAEDPTFARDFPAEVYTIRPVAEVERLLSVAGFDDVSTATSSLGKATIAWTTAGKARPAG